MAYSEVYLILMCLGFVLLGGIVYFCCFELESREKKKFKNASALIRENYLLEERLESKSSKDLEANWNSNDVEMEDRASDSINLIEPEVDGEQPEVDKEQPKVEHFYTDKEPSYSDSEPHDAESGNNENILANAVHPSEENAEDDLTLAETGEVPPQ